MPTLSSMARSEIPERLAGVGGTRAPAMLAGPAEAA